jgi:4-amino-4-deoxy-L-arabinose transferase-like glycosyltransferase
MSTKGNALISALLVVLGVLFIWLHDRESLATLIIVLCGLAFVVPALISLAALVWSGRRESAEGAVKATGSTMRIVQLICGVGGLILGVCIIVFPEVFSPLLVYPFAALLICGGGVQLFLLAHRNRPTAFPMWMLLPPVLTLIAGVLTLCVAPIHDNLSVILLLTGIASLLCGVNGLVGGFIARRALKLSAESAKLKIESTGATESTESPESTNAI